MAAFHSYHGNNSFTSYSRQYHYYPTLPAITGDQDVALSGYVQAVYGLTHYLYLVPVHYHQFVPCDDSWIMNPHEQQGNYYYHTISPYDQSWIMDAQEEEEDLILTEEELRHFDLIDEEVVVYDTTRDDDGLSKETIITHLNTRNHHSVDAHNICVVCQDSLFQKEEKIATLECGHDFHVGCIKSWLMIKNCCPLCKATGIHLEIHEDK